MDIALVIILTITVIQYFVILGNLHNIKTQNHFLIHKIHTMSEVLDKINAAIQEISDSITNVAADINGLVANQVDGLSAEQATDIATRLQTAADNLKATADIVPDAPVTPQADGGDTPVEPEA